MPRRTNDVQGETVFTAIISRSNFGVLAIPEARWAIFRGIPGSRPRSVQTSGDSEAQVADGRLCVRNAKEDILLIVAQMDTEVRPVADRDSWCIPSMVCVVTRVMDCQSQSLTKY